MTRFSSLPLNAAEPQRTLGCSGREFVDDLDDAENLDILPMTNYGRSGYHRLLAGASGDKHAHTVTRCGLHGHARTPACHCPAHVAQLRSQVGWAQLSRFGGLGVGDDRPRVPLGSPAQQVAGSSCGVVIVLCRGSRSAETLALSPNLPVQQLLSIYSFARL